MADLIPIKIEGRWTLDELAELSRKYTEVYSFVYAIHPVAKRERTPLFSDYPWRGGYSTVNFFNELYYRIPENDRPTILRIKYSSPGEILLLQVLPVAIAVAGLVTTVALALTQAEATYDRIRQGITKRKLGKINLRRAELRLEREELGHLKEQMQFIEESYKTFTSDLGLSEEMIAILNRRASGNQLAQLKMLMSLYRRIEPLKDFQRNGKLDVTGFLTPDSEKQYNDDDPGS